MRKSIPWLCLAVVLAAGCSEDPHTAANQDASPCPEGQDRVRDCLGGKYSCIVPYPDAGKRCTDSSQCAGECVIELTIVCDEAGKCVDPIVPNPGTKVAGSCKRYPRTCGSVVPVQNGIAQAVRLHD